MQIKIDSTLQRQINTARLSEAEREVALNAVRTATLIVDAAEWLVKKTEQFAASIFARPGYRH